MVDIESLESGAAEPSPTEDISSSSFSLPFSCILVPPIATQSEPQAMETQPPITKAISKSG